MRELVKAAPQVLITSPDPHKLQALVAREKARRSIVVVTPQTMVAPGVWGVGVYQLKPLRRPWVLPAAAGAGLVGLGGLAWLLVGLLVSLGLATVLGALAVGALILRFARPRGGECRVDVSVRHRH